MSFPVRNGTLAPTPQRDPYLTHTLIYVTPLRGEAESRRKLAYSGFVPHPPGFGDYLSFQGGEIRAYVTKITWHYAPPVPWAEITAASADYDHLTEHSSR